jgi:hypothetical protein
LKFIHRRLHSQNNDLAKQYVPNVLQSKFEPIRRRNLLQQPFHQVFSNPVISHDINQSNSSTNRMIGSHYRERHNNSFQSLSSINPKPIDQLNVYGFPLDVKSVQIECTNSHQTRSTEKRIKVLSTIVLKKNENSNHVEPTETIVISDAEDESSGMANIRQMECSGMANKQGYIEHD